MKKLWLNPDDFLVNDATAKCRNKKLTVLINILKITNARFLPQTLISVDLIGHYCGRFPRKGSNYRPIGTFAILHINQTDTKDKQHIK